MLVNESCIFCLSGHWMRIKRFSCDYTRVRGALAIKTERGNSSNMQWATPQMTDYLSSHHFRLINESTHEIMALIALRKLNLQTRIRSNPLGLHI